MKIVSVEQMQAIERSVDAGGLSYEQMMNNAGRGVASWVCHNLNLQRGVIGLIGSGNNGGDTLIALKDLAQRGFRTTAFIVKQRGEDPLIQDYLLHGGSLIDLSENQNMAFLEASLEAGTNILEGVLGTGLKLPLRGTLFDVMGNIYQRVKKRPDTVVIAVDCPSGIDCDSGEVSDVTLPAQHTLCMAAIKQGLLIHPGRSYVGNLHLVKIGISEIESHLSDSLPEMINKNLVVKHLPSRPDSGHKGTFGTCMVIAGTKAFTGAAFLVGKAAYRSGCGLVNIATLPDVQSALAGNLIEAVWTVLPEKDGAYAIESLAILKEKLTAVDSLVIGPGWGLQDDTREFLEALLGIIPKSIPTLFDADGLKLLKNIERWWERLPKNSILTPHPGEMAVLTGLDVQEIQSNRWRIAQDYADQWKVHLILKGAVTVISGPSGELLINPVSDSVLATAGSGDVLSGIIGGLLAQGASSIDACTVGTWVHSQAGVAARRQLGSDVVVTALDISDAISEVFKAYYSGE